MARRARPRRLRRGAGRDPAGILAGDGVELFGFDRRARPRRRAGVGDEARPLLRGSGSSGRSAWPTPPSTCRRRRRTGSATAWALSRRARARCSTITARRAPGAGPPKLLAGGAGLVSTIADYHRFCAMLLNGGELGGARIVGRKTLELMTANHLPGGADLTEMSRSLFSEAINAGQGFGLGFGVNLDPAKTMLPGSQGRILLGRNVLDRLLRRSGRAAAHDLHDPADAVIDLSGAAAAQDFDLFGFEIVRHPGGSRDLGVEKFRLVSPRSRLSPG